VKNLALMLLAVALAVSMMAPVRAQEPPPQMPKDGNGLLDYCSHLVDALDSPSSQLGPLGQGAAAGSIVYAHNTFKQGWCMGHLLTMREMIIFWQVQVAKTVVILGGTQNPSVEVLKDVISKSPDMTCIPDKVSQPQLARVLVKWLRDHPERLHESVSILSGDAFKSAFPCQALATIKKPNP